MIRAGTMPTFDPAPQGTSPYGPSQSDILNSPEAQQEIGWPTLMAQAIACNWLPGPNVSASWPDSDMLPVESFAQTAGLLIPYPNTSANNPAAPKASEIEGQIASSLQPIENYLLGSP